MLSPNNTPSEMNRNLSFYDRYGVKEYYIYDPDNGESYGYVRSGERLTQILENMQGYQSPILKITFEIGEKGELKIFDPAGMPLLSYREQTERFFQEHKMRIAEEKAKEEALKMLEEERKAKEEALAELERLRQLFKDKNQ